MTQDRATITRRRFVAISAAAIGVAVAGLSIPAAANAPLARWRGVALGAAASITLRHPEADRIVTACRAEIDRLEDIFSLYRGDSALSRLNADGKIDAPPFELLELLGRCGALHAATGGLFDPTVQPLWAAYAEAFAGGRAPDADTIARALERVGWASVSTESGRIAFLKPGMALTLNGIAQGYVADRVAGLLAAEGLTDILIDTGEHRALGERPAGGGWPVTLAQGGAVALRERALATSAPLGTVFDARGRFGHILDPRSGEPAAPRWRGVSITAPAAALADALSTAACLMPDRAAIDSMAARFRGADCVSAVGV